MRANAGAKDTKAKAIAELLGDPKPGTVSPVECFAMAVRMRALGADGVTVVVAGGGKR